MTAVEWLIQQICGEHTEAWHEEIQQALEMEKEQIKQAQQVQKGDYFAVMNSVLTELYNELSQLNDTIKNVGSDNHEYYLGRIKGIESSIKIIEKHNS